MEAGSVIDAWLAEGQRRFPEVELDADAFRASVRAHVGTDDVQGGDLYLATACARGDEAALRRFDADYLAKIPHWLKLPARDEEILREVRQRVAARALVGGNGTPPRIASYAGRGPLWAWVRIIALREHARLRSELGRQQAIEVNADDELAELARSGELSADMLAIRARYQPAMTEAFRAALAALSAHDRTLLRMVYVEGVSLQAAGRMYGVNKSTISRRLATVRADLLADAGRRLRHEIGIPVDELESLLGLMPRDLDVSLDGLLQA